MAKTKSTQSKASKRLPTRELLEQRLETQRDRALAARGICAMITRAANAIEDQGGFYDAAECVNPRAALEGLTELPDSVKEDIDPETILAAGEIDEAEVVS